MTTPIASLGELAARLQHLQDRVELSELMGRYGRLLDEQNWSEFRTLFAEDVRAEHGVVTPPIEGIEPFMGMIQAVSAMVPTVQHFVTNVGVTVDNDVARIDAFILAMHDLPRKPSPRGTRTVLGEPNDIVPAGGRYEVHLKRASVGWKIQTLVVHETWIDHRVPAIYAAPSL